MTRRQALAVYLNSTEVRQGRDKQTFNYGAQDYLVLSDKEATRKAREMALRNLWICDPEFLGKFVNLPVEHIKHILKLKFGANLILRNFLTLNKNQEARYVEAVINSDGRGFYVSGYDNIEGQVEE